MALSSTIRSELSDRELSLLAAAFASLAQSDRNINWEKFTQVSGYASVNSARVCFRPIVKKLDAIVENGCNGGVCDGNQSALPKAATARRAPKAKKNNDATKPTTKTQGHPKKRKYGDGKAVGGDMQTSPAGVQGIGLGMAEGSADSQCFADVAREATVEGAGACLFFAVPENGQDDDAKHLAVDASGSAGTYTGAFPEANRLVPPAGSTPAMDPGNDDNAAAVVDPQTAAEQPESKKLRAFSPAAEPRLKTEGEDIAFAQQLACEAALKTEEVGKQPLTASPGLASIHNITDAMESKDARLMTLEADVSSVFKGVSRVGQGHRADLLPTSVKSMKAASPEMEESISFEDQRISYAESLDFGFEEYSGLEDAI